MGEKIYRQGEGEGVGRRSIIFVGDSAELLPTFEAFRQAPPLRRLEHAICGKGTFILSTALSKCQSKSMLLFPMLCLCYCAIVQVYPICAMQQEHMRETLQGAGRRGGGFSRISESVGLAAQPTTFGTVCLGARGHVTNQDFCCNGNLCYNVCAI